MNHMLSELSHVYGTVPHVGKSRKTDNHSGAAEAGWKRVITNQVGAGRGNVL